jgi:hypothetical protein
VSLSVARITFFDAANPRLEDGFDTWITFPEEFSVEGFNRTEPESFVFWRRWQAGFWPWNGEFMDGEANKVWEAIGALERRADNHAASLEMVSATLTNILAVLKKQAEPEPEVRRLYSFSMLDSSPQASRAVPVEAEPGIQYEAWSKAKEVWVPVTVVRLPDGEEEEEDAFDESDDD